MRFCGDSYYRAGFASRAALRLRFGLVLAGLLVFVLTTLVAAVQPSLASDDKLFLAGLRELRLYSLVESYCRQRLQAPQLSDAERADLTVELARGLAAKALDLPLTSSELTWQQAAAVTSDFATRFPENSRGLLVELQGALVSLAHGEVLREQAAFTDGGEQRFEPAKLELRSAIETLGKLRSRATNQQREKPAAAAKTDPLTATELATVVDHIDRQLARAYRLQASCSPVGTPESMEGLNQAIGYLRQLLQRKTSNEHRWEGGLELAACLRESGDLGLARQALDQLDASHPTAAIVLRARAERVRIALATGVPRAALEILATGRNLDGQVSPELDTAFLETYLALSADAHRQQRGTEADEFQQRADAVLSEIEKTHGPYWARRAELTASQRASSSGTSDSLETLVQTAIRLHAAGQIDESLAAYDRAVSDAFEAGEAQHAFELAFTAATIEHQRKNFAAASNRYRLAAKQLPTAARAAEAHLLAAHDSLEAAKLVEPLSTRLYREILDEHLRLWPSGASHGEAQWRLGRLETFERRWPQAVAAYRLIDLQDPRFTDAVTAMASAYGSWFAELRATGKDANAQIVLAAREFDHLATSTKVALPESSHDARRAAALAAAQLWIDSVPANLSRAERLARQVLSDEESPDALRARALPLLVIALAGQGKAAEARQPLEQMSGTDPAELLKVLNALETTATSRGPDLARELAPLELQTIALLRGKINNLPPEAQQRLRRREARMLADSGQRPDAQAAYEALLQAAPRDGALREEFAAFLGAGDDAASRAAGLAAWRDLERHSKPGSERWFRAKYEIALALHQAGDDAQAAKTIALIKVLHPDLGGAESRARFTVLEAQLNPQNKSSR